MRPQAVRRPGGETRVAGGAGRVLLLRDGLKYEATGPAVWPVAALFPGSFLAHGERNRQERNGKARPALLERPPSLTGYDTVLLCCPVWNSSAPMIMRSFIKAVDLSGKTVCRSSRTPSAG